MTALNAQLEEKQNVINGTMTQAKGMVREQLGQLQNEELTRLAGKKDQVIGQLQTNYGDSWIVRHNKWILIGAGIATLFTIAATLFARNYREDTDRS